MSVNRLSGSLPTHIGQPMPNLHELYLDANLFTGQIPAEIMQLESLEWVWMFRNLLSGKLPETWATKVVDVVLFDNQITGRMPAMIGKLTSLVYLLLESNKLTGIIPSELGYLQHVQRLELNDNLLTGRIPTEVGKLTSLESKTWHKDVETEWLPVEAREFHLQSNRLSGSLPSQLSLLQRFNSINLADNRFTGDIPPELTSMMMNGSLVFLRVNHNALTGTIPAGVCSPNATLIFDCDVLICGCDCECDLSSIHSQLRGAV